MDSGDTLHILLVAQDAARAMIVCDGLKRGRYSDVTLVSDMAGLIRRVVADDIGVLLIDLQTPSAAALEMTLDIARAVDRPVAIFVDISTAADTRAAMEAGVSAYIINDLRAERIEPIVDMAICRFDAQKTLRNRLADTEQALKDRKIIEKAKGFLMSRKGMTEDEAYRLLQQTAMNQERRLIDVAQGIVHAVDLL